MISRFSIEPIITKTRHCIKHDNKTWSVDVFEGTNKGLIFAEVEVGLYENETITLPPWVGDEVTTDLRYGNSSLARRPFITWDHAPEEDRVAALFGTAFASMNQSV